MVPSFIGDLSRGLTCTSCGVQIRHRRPCPPDTDVILRSHILDVSGGSSSGYPGLGGKVSVEVELLLLLPEGGRSNLISTARGIFKRVAAVRAL